MQKTTVRRAIGVAQRIKAVKKPTVYRIFSVLLCFLISRAEMFGTAMPLGISYLAVISEGSTPLLPYIIACALGLLTSPSGFVYIPSAVILFFITYFEHKATVRTRFVTGLYASAAVLISGLPAVLLLGGYAIDMLRLLICSCAVFFSVYVFGAALCAVNAKGGRRYLSQEEIVVITITFALAAMGLSPCEFGYVSPINVICSLFIMTVSLCGSPTTSAAAGVVGGFIFGSGTQFPFEYMGLCGLCGLASGLMGRFGKAGAAVTFVLCAIVNAVSVESTGEILFTPLDTAIAVVLFFAVPIRLLKLAGIYKCFEKNSEAQSAVHAVSDRLGFISGAFSQMSDTIRFFGSGEGKKRFSRFDMFDKAADSVCRDCKNCTLCWQKYYNDTYDITMKCFHEVDKHGEVTADFLPSFFKERCTDCSAFVSSINRTYEQFKDELVWRGRLFESGELSAGRFADAARLVDTLCDELRDNASFNAELARGVAAALDGAGISVNSVSVFKNPYGRYEVKIKMPSCGGRDLCRSMEPIISEIMERSMAKNEGECMLGECSILFSEASIVTVEHSIIGRASKGREVSGDCAAAYTLPDGNELMLLCDGRGSGAEANLLSCEAVRLISKLMNAGFAPDAAVRLANSAMAESGDGESFSTVDAAVVNTLNGSCIFVKNGCCPTFVLNNGEIKRIGCENLPVGVGDETEVTEKYGSLEDGDLIIMMSDGVYDSFSDEKTLNSEIMKLDNNESTEKLASRILKAALKRKGTGDDMTVLVTKIKFN